MKNWRRLRFLFVVIGFVLVGLEFVFASNTRCFDLPFGLREILVEVALYQSLILSVYLLFNILFEVSTWFQKQDSGLRYLGGRLLGGAILSVSWFIFGVLLSFIAPWLSYYSISLLSLGIVLLMVLTVIAYQFMVERRSGKRTPRMMRNAVKKASHGTTRKRRRTRQLSVRAVISISILMIPLGFLLFCLAWFTPVLHTRTGLLQAQVAAFGLTLILMGIVFPIARVLQERHRRLKRILKRSEKQATVSEKE